MIIFSLFVLQVLPAAFCYDIELNNEAKVELANLAALRQPSELINLILNYLPEKYLEKGKLPNALETIAIHFLRTRNNTKETKTQIRNNKTHSPKQTEKPISHTNVFLNYLQVKGTETIKKISTQILKDLNMEMDITSIVEITADNYRNNLQNYYDYVKKNEHDSDRALLFLDMVGTSTRLLFEGEKKMLNDILKQEYQNNHENISKELMKSSFLYKRHVMKYLCNTFEVCKEYPVSYYGAEILNEVIKLDDVKFITFLKTLYKIYKENAKIFSKFTEDEDKQLFMEILQRSTHKLISSRVFFAFFRAMITQRFKPITSDHEEFKLKTKAVRLLLDIFDKALNVEDDVIIIDIENSLQAIRDWVADKRDDIEKTLEEFVKSLIIRFEHNLTKIARKEIKTLVTAFVRENTKAFYHLMKCGSKYLKGK